MKRSNVSLIDVTDWHNLVRAFTLAAKGKRDRPDVQSYAANLESTLTDLRCEVLDGTWSPGPMRAFEIRDPKPRRIHAPCFRDRVLHHAVMAHVGPVLDRVLVDDSFACRKHKGTLASVQRVQHHMRRFNWYTQIDIQGYFATIDHEILLRLLRRRLKNPGMLALLEKIIANYHVAPGKGLPIGALTSQHFANFYLAGFDRVLLERWPVRAMVRYMDDTVWFSDTRADAQRTLQQAFQWIPDELLLCVKEPPVIGRCDRSITFCGYRIRRGPILLSRRRKRRYVECRRRWEDAFAAGRIDEIQLQQAYASALGMTVHADAVSWRREQLRRSPPHESVAAL